MAIWKSITKPPEGGFVVGKRYLVGYWSDGVWITDTYIRRPNDWYIGAGILARYPEFWQDVPASPLEIDVKQINEDNNLLKRATDIFDLLRRAADLGFSLILEPDQLRELIVILEEAKLEKVRAAK